jgi:hypothetical protein
MRDLNCLRRCFPIAVVVLFAATGIATAQLKTAPRLRVIVKVRAKLAKDVEASLPMQTMAVTAGQPASASVQSFMNRHRGQQLAPVYPGIVRAKKQRGVTDLEFATSVRQKFPIRANRLRGGFRPPEISRTYILEVDSTDKTVLNKLLSDLKADPDVEFAEPDHLVSVRATPNDPYFFSSGTWGQSYDDLWGIKKIGAPAAWDTSTGAGVTVAVVDTGLDYTHPDIVGNVWTNTRESAGNGLDDDGNGYVDDTRGWDFIGSDYLNPTQSNDPIDHQGHGTHVAGTIAATGNNGIGVIGVAWQAQVMPVKGLDDQGIGLDSTLGPAILYAANNGADVISNSWAGTGTSQTIAEAVDYAYNLGVVVVAAAGNNSDDAMNYYPANLSEVITVAASDPYDSIAYFSNWGTKIDIAAPGVDILSLRAAGTFLGSPVDDYYTRADGTSMATPHVSGLAALILSQHPNYINEDVRQAVRASASDLGVAGFDQTFGYGRIDATAALALPDVLQCKIQSPINSTHVNVPTVISGVVQGSAFSRYVLEYGSGASPTSWITIQTGTSPVAGGALGTFDASTLGDGVYTIRLTGYDLSNRAFVDRITLVIDYISISSPVPPTVPTTAQEFKPGTIVPVQGTASGATFHDFRMQWAEGINPTSGWSSSGITLAGGGSSPVSNGPLGTWDTSSITKADYYTLQLLVDNSGFASQANTLVYLEPDLLSANWPKWLDEVPGQFSGIVPAVDGGGNVRLALSIPTYSDSVLPPRLRTFSADGSVEQSLSLNFGDYFQPAAADFDGNAGDELVMGDGNMLRIVRSDNTSNTFTGMPSLPLQQSQVVLADLDGDSQLEALAIGNDFAGNAYIFAWRRDGQQVGANFPIAIADQNSSVVYPSGPRLLAGDIDGDGKPEIIAQEGTSPSTFALRLFGNDGSPKVWAAPVFPGYPISMVLADLDHDGKLELVMTTNTFTEVLIHVLQSDGTERPGWPVPITYGSPYIAVGDLNVDGHEEIVVAGGLEVHVFNPDGTSFSSAWPQTTDFTFGPVAIADVDGDGYPEIVTTSLESFAASNPLFPAASGQPKPVVTRDKSIVLQNARINVGAQDATNLQYWETELQAFRRDGTIAKSWRLVGANGNQPWIPTMLTVGDFNKDGITDIAAAYDLTVPTNGIGFASQGVATVLSTGATFHPSVNDWPMIYQNPRNTATLIRDHKPPSVSITSPVAGAAVGGSVTIAAAASDNVGITSVQFLVDGANLGTADTTAPFSAVWNTSGVSSGSHSLTAVASDAAGNVTTSAPVAVVVGVPKAAFSPTILAYGSQLVGTSSSMRSVTLTSTGSATVSISGITVTGDFSQTNNCGNALLPGTVCTVKVAFKPTVRGKRMGSVTLNSNISGTAPVISLSGTGIGPVASVSPGALYFAAQVVNTSSATKAVTLTNTGETTLHILSISTSGDFSQSNKCGAALLASAKCTINVTFKPTAYGARAGSLTIADDASGSSQTVGLNGTGLDYSLSASPSSVTVNSGGSALYVINVRALGGIFSPAVSLSCSGLPAASACSFSRVSVVPGATSTNSTMTVNTTTRHGSSGTPAGTYTVTVTGASGSTQHSTTVKLKVN